MKNNIVTIILVVVIGAVAFWYINKNPNDTGSALVSSNQTADSVDAKYIYNTLQQMKMVTLTSDIFDNTVFQNLKDNTVNFSSQPVGRNNPFSPTGSDTIIPGQTSPSATSSVR